MADPLAILAFDHRESFLRSFLGVGGEPSDGDRARASTAKAVIAEGLLRALDGGAPRGSAAALVDATYGAEAIERVRSADVRVAVPVEESGRAELVFEPGWRERLVAFEPAWAKVLVRFNPHGDAGMNRRQLGRLGELAAHCRDQKLDLMLELLVPPEQHQAGRTYDTEIRPHLVEEAIGTVRDAGIGPALWKVEGFEHRAAYEAVAAVAAAPCVVLGRGQDERAVARWLTAAVGVEGFVGFAIGRSIWWDPLAAFLAGGDRDDAIAAIAAAYLRMIAVWRAADG
jgi:myo-inositol catabolism protein IolC